jgi:hypothetical protein
MDKGIDALLEPFLSLCNVPVDEVFFAALATRPSSSL